MKSRLALSGSMMGAVLLLLNASPIKSAPLPSAEFDRLHAVIKPQPGESRWMEIDWYPSVWEGRQVAARTGKPLFLMAGSGGAPCVGC